LRQADWNIVFLVTSHKRKIKSEVWREGKDRDVDERFEQSGARKRNKDVVPISSRISEEGCTSCEDGLCKDSGGKKKCASFSIAAI
jgi:hypothetical protein